MFKRMPGPVAVLVIVGSALLASPASASVTIGQTGDVSVGGCQDDEAYAQKAISAGAGYSPSVYGVITSWGARSKAAPNQSVKLLVLRDDGSDQLSVVARDSAVRTLSSVDDALNTFTGTRIPIEPSQRIGVYLPAGSLEGCNFNTGNAGDESAYSVPFDVGEPPDNVPFDYSGFDSGNRVNAQAVVEPDTDRDIFGDETQDQCPGQAGPANGCQSPTGQRAAALKKCKKKAQKKDWTKKQLKKCKKKAKKLPV